MKVFLFTVLSVVACSWCLATAATHNAVNDAVQDKFVPANTDHVLFDGVIGSRMKTCLRHRLMTIDIDSILTPYTDRPGVGW